MKARKLALVVAFLAALLFPGIELAQTDPGVRSNTGVNAGQPLASVAGSANDSAFFQTGLAQFTEHHTVTGDNPGLGPLFNSDSDFVLVCLSFAECAQCCKDLFFTSLQPL